MNLRKHIQKEIGKIISENDNLPWGAQYIKDAPYNQEDGSIRKGKTPKENKYQAVWYESGSGLALLKDAGGNLYAFSTDSVDGEDYEPYAERDEIYLGKDEDGMPDTELGDWSLNRDVIQNYVNDNLDSLQMGKGLSDYNDGISLVEIDEDLKLELLDFATKYIRLGKEELIDVLSNYNSSMNEATISEAKMTNEPFEKVVFRYEFPSNEHRKMLMDIIRNHFGEPLGKSREEKYWSTYIPKLELEKFLIDAADFNPNPTGDIIQASRFKPLTKGLKDGDIIAFYDYTVSENNPPRAEGYLKPGFIQRNRSLLKWNDGAKEAWIDNSMIDKYYFYHGDVSDIKGHSGSRSIDNEKYTKIFFDDQTLNNMSLNQEDELRNIITAHKGQLRYVFGKERASGGQRYTMIPTNLADDFIQAAYDFGAYDAETERNIYLEDKALNEIRKIVRGIVNKVVK